MKWVVFTCPERQAEALETLRSLGETDFPGRPFLELDHGNGPPSRERQIVARVGALQRLLRDFPRERLFALFDDDIVFNRFIWSHLWRWRATRRIHLFASLYRRGMGRAMPPDHTRDELASGFECAQALLLSRPVVEGLCLNWHSVASDLPWDRHLGAVAALLGLTVTYHLPSLVQHRSPASLVGSAPHRSACFSEEWGEPSIP